LFSYESKGEDVVLEVKIVDGEDDIEFHLNGKSIGLTSDDFIGCEDIDDCALVVAKHLIKDNDGEVETAFADSNNSTLTGLIYTKMLTKDLEYNNGDMNDESWLVTLCANQSHSVTSYDYYEIPEDEVDEIVSLISNRDDDTLCDVLWDRDRETVEVFEFNDIAGLTYEVSDSNGDIVKDGVIRVTPNNIFSYDGCEGGQIVNENHHPEYLLLVSDTMKRSNTTFCVPKDFQIGEIHFGNSRLATLRLLDWYSMFGDYVTSIGSFRYRGKTYYADDFCDAGSYEDRKFAIFKWNEEKKRYDLLAEM
jgi:hypothetical protein